MKRYLIVLLALACLITCASAMISFMDVEACVSHPCGTKVVYIRPITQYGPDCDPILVVKNKVSLQILGQPDGTPITFVATSPSWTGERNCTIKVNGVVVPNLPYECGTTKEIKIIVPEAPVVTKEKAKTVSTYKTSGWYTGNGWWEKYVTHKPIYRITSYTDIWESK